MDNRGTHHAYDTCETTSIPRPRASTSGRRTSGGRCPREPHVNPPGIHTAPPGTRLETHLLGQTATLSDEGACGVLPHVDPNGIRTTPPDILLEMLLRGQVPPLSGEGVCVVQTHVDPAGIRTTRPGVRVTTLLQGQGPRLSDPGACGVQPHVNPPGVCTTPPGVRSEVLLQGQVPPLSDEGARAVIHAFNWFQLICVECNPKATNLKVSNREALQVGLGVFALMCLQHARIKLAGGPSGS